MLISPQKSDDLRRAQEGGLGGVPQDYLPFVLCEMARQGALISFVTVNNEQLFLLEQQIKVLAPNVQIFTLPGWDCLPYDRVGPSADITNKRMNTLVELANQDVASGILLISSNAYIQKIAPKAYYKDKHHIFKVGDTLSRGRLLDILIEFGYQKVSTVYQVGDYAVRGSIIDVFVSGHPHPLRIDFFDDDIETLCYFEIDTQTTLQKNGSLITFSLRPSAEIVLNTDATKHFCKQYAQIDGDLPLDGDALYQAMMHQRTFQGYEHWLPLYCDQEFVMIDHHVDAHYIYFDHRVPDFLTDQQSLIHDYYLARRHPVTGHYAHRPLAPDLFYRQEIGQHHIISPYVAPNAHDMGARLLTDFPKLESNADFFDDAIAYIHKHARDKKILFACATTGLYDRVIEVLGDQGLSCAYDHLIIPLEKGFITPQQLVVTDQDILGSRRFAKNQRKKQTKRFFTELSELEINDLVVHRDHGIGKYMGLLTMHVQGISHDCLMIEYHGGNKLYLPVENIELIARYGGEMGFTQLDSLGDGRWAQRKNQVKKRVQLIADYLIKLAAERAQKTGDVFNPTHPEYQVFCKRFPYTETDDQLTAITDVENDLASGKPMDRLVCGDVGFGKTEVALRAAFLAACHGKQVAILTPTTLLCRQHAKNFIDRFHGAPYKVAQLSRFVTASEAKKVREGLKDGSIHILIATHALIKSDIHFKDLGLFIIDEEQHFGVKQKEKLRLQYADVHSLTLTATPIPRTLQLSLSGVRDLSLITTPPLDRLAVRTFVVLEDSDLIKDAILKECNRGGQVFYVCPHVADQPRLVEKLKNMLPDLRFAVVNGTLSGAAMENILNDFADRHYDLLLATNILESGIDMPSVNTIILHQAHLFGLAQLYQLRGRVGRSKIQAYAYFTIPQKGSLTDNAIKRLEILQSLDKLGAGFNLASHDMDIRGGGNILGEEQSGHIKEVGIEMYQRLLQEAILIAKAESQGDAFVQDWTPQINLGCAILIPQEYVSDLTLRLGLYKRLSFFNSVQEIDAFAAELVDRFGKLPLEVRHLLQVYELKLMCKQAGILTLDVGPKGFLIGFYNNHFPHFEGLIRFLQMPEMARRSKIRSDHKIFIQFETGDIHSRFAVCKKVCAKILQIMVESA